MAECEEPAAFFVQMQPEDRVFGFLTHSQGDPIAVRQLLVTFDADPNFVLETHGWQHGSMRGTIVADGAPAQPAVMLP